MNSFGSRVLHCSLLPVVFPLLPADFFDTQHVAALREDGIARRRLKFWLQLNKAEAMMRNILRGCWFSSRVF